MFLQQFIKDLNCSLKVSTTIILQVKNKVLHTITLHLLNCVYHLSWCSCSEGRKSDISHPWSNHIRRFYCVKGYFVTSNNKRKDILYTSTLNTNLYLCTLWSTESFHNILLRHFHSSNDSIIYSNKTVSCNNSHSL